MIFKINKFYLDVIRSLELELSYDVLVCLYVYMFICCMYIVDVFKNNIMGMLIVNKG